MRYAAQEKKTRWENKRLVSGVNCRPESAYDDFLNTKLLYHKEGGTLFFHLVQSFPKDERVDPAAAHAAALKLAEWFNGREVLVCTHVDRDHIHSHLLINSVSLENGKKLHIAQPELEELRRYSDQICMELGLPVFQPARKKRVKSLSGAEYHAAAKGESWKFRLMNTIDACMRRAASREEFIALMKRVGYVVRWEEERRSITYTIPSGMKCRDDRLHDERYLKEAMEREFRIRAAILHRRAAAEEFAGAVGDPAARPSHGGGVGKPAGHTECPLPADGGGARDAGTSVPSVGPPRPGETGGDADEGDGGNPQAPRTGWEAERAALFHPQASPVSAAPLPGVAVPPGRPDELVGDLAQLGYALERIQSPAPVEVHPRSDSKTLQRERRKKVALGHRSNDREDEPDRGMTMT